MPFGAVGSVSSFLRASMAIWFIGVRGLRLCWSCFFDDFTILSTRAGSGSAALAAESLFKLLGVRFAEDGDKAVTWGKLSQREVDSLIFLQQRVLTAPPTRIMTTNLSTWYIFTDGACEGDSTKVGSIGGVLINPSGVAVEFFGNLVPDYIMSAFLSEAKHPIFELELLPVLVALCIWKEYLHCCQCVFFLDNEAAKGALIHGATKTVFGEKIISAFVNLEMQQQVKVWFSRVPTSSNVSDKPSRMDFKEVLDVGATHVSIPWSWIQELVGIVGS